MNIVSWANKSVSGRFLFWKQYYLDVVCVVVLGMRVVFRIGNGDCGLSNWDSRYWLSEPGDGCGDGRRGVRHRGDTSPRYGQHGAKAHEFECHGDAFNRWTDGKLMMRTSDSAVYIPPLDGWNSGIACLKLDLDWSWNVKLLCTCFFR